MKRRRMRVSGSETSIVIPHYRERICRDFDRERVIRHLEEHESMSTSVFKTTQEPVYEF